MLDPGWVGQNHRSFDVFHLHFGFDAQTPAGLRELTSTLRAHAKPLIYTVHDLRNPHHRDPSAHDAHLDVLVPAADELITLTPGAAEVIDRRWGRTAEVVSHPHVVGPDEAGVARAGRDEFVVGVHVKSLRANMNCRPVIETLARTVAALPAAVLRVDVHSEVLDPASAHHHPELVTWLFDARDRGALRLRVHDFFTDEQLWAYLRDEIDVSVLPYRFGTHSGWLEACHDLGTVVVAPSCGFYVQQRPCLEYRHDDTGLDTDSLADAVRTAYRRRPQWRASVTARRAERRQVAAAHRDLYERALA